MLEFLVKLDENLTKSMSLFKDRKQNNITKSSNIELIYKFLKKNNENLYKYLELLNDLESELVSDTLDSGSECDNNSFLFSFDIDSKLYQKNFKKEFKNNMQTGIKLHKLKKSINKGLTYNSLDNITLSSIDSVDIGPNKISIPIVDNIKDIPPMFYWFEGDKYYKKGIYTCISPGFYSRVPFPDTIPSYNNNFKVNSIPCKYKTKQACSEAKYRNSNIYNSEIRDCSYLHTTEKFIKMGTTYRCNIESFGHHKTLNYDMDFITNNDIKRLLLYSLSDSLLSALWYQNRFKNGNLILTNIDVYDNA